MEISVLRCNFLIAAMPSLRDAGGAGMNLPNSITLARIFLTVFFVGVLSFSWPYAFGAAFLLFLIASVTDFLDGYLARRLGLVTDFGKLMDPLADKILVISGLVLLAVAHLLPAWFVIVVLFREFLVTGMRMLALAEQRVIAADRWGKLKTILQIVLVCLILGIEGLRELGWTRLAEFPLWHWARDVTFYLALVITVGSGIGYLRNFFKPNV